MLRTIRSLRVRALVGRLTQLTLVVIGLRWILAQALAAQGGKTVWVFGQDDRHRYTSMAMLTGTLRMHGGLTYLGPDDQAYGGAAYTNWGFGVPSMQLPFHAVAPWLGKHWTSHAKHFVSGFFPDRAIFFTYMVLLAAALWLALDRAFAAGVLRRAGWLRRTFAAGASVALIFNLALYPLVSSRFIVYEETLAYFVVVQLFAVSAYVFVRERPSSWPVCALAVAAGLGLLTRATGVGYLGMWGLLVLLERRTVRSVVTFAAAAAPFTLFWLYSNWAKSGSPVSFGYENGMPWFSYHTGMLRFRNYTCADTARHAWVAAKELFQWLFVSVADPTDAHLKQCHFVWEARAPGNSREAFLGPWVLAFLCWVTAHYAARRERRLSLYVPIATCVFLFFNYARTVGFAWRYVGDFWPLLVLIAVQYARWLPSRVGPLPYLRMAACFYLLSLVLFKTQVETAVSSIQNASEAQIAGLPAAFKRSRYGEDAALPSRIACGAVPSWPYHNGEGWSSSCGVDTCTDVFLHVPKKADGSYELRFATQGFDMPRLRVFVNGRVYTATRQGEEYSAPVTVDYGRLVTPTVVVAVEWTSKPDPIPGKLLWIELT